MQFFFYEYFYESINFYIIYKDEFLEILKCSYNIFIICFIYKNNNIQQ